MLSDLEKIKLRKEVKERFYRLYDHYNINQLKDEIKFQLSHNKDIEKMTDLKMKERATFYHDYWIKFLKNIIKKKNK